MEIDTEVKEDSRNLFLQHVGRLREGGWWAIIWGVDDRFLNGRGRGISSKEAILSALLDVKDIRDLRKRSSTKVSAEIDLLMRRE